MGENLFEIRGLSKSFGDLHVLDRVDLDIERGAVTTIIGRSGVGKSVLLKHLIGLLQPDGGQVLFHGSDLARMNREQKGKLKRSVSYMFQNLALFDSMTVFENVAMPLEEKSRMQRGEIARRVREMIERLDLGNITGKYPSQISGGMRKRVALARALITEPEAVLFDEPTTGLDPVRRNGVHGMITHYQREFGFTAVIVSHDIPEVFSVSQYVAMLEEGRILYFGPADEIEQCRDEAVRRFLEGRDDEDAA